LLDGAVFVPLAAVRDPELVPSTLAKVLGLLDGDGQSPAARLVAALRDLQMLLILDNIEHLEPMGAGAIASSLVIDLLTTCPGVKILHKPHAVPHLGKARLRGPAIGTAAYSASGGKGSAAALGRFGASRIHPTLCQSGADGLAGFRADCRESPNHGGDMCAGRRFAARN
jgi:non-specific serine/threonine protein kinase